MIHTRVNKMRVILLSIICCVFGCTPQADSIPEYKAWFNDPENGFLKEKYINNLRIAVQHRPVDYMLINEVKGWPEDTPVPLDSLRHSYGNSSYFFMEVGFDERSESKSGDLMKDRSITYQEYTEQVNDLSFGMQDNVWLIMNGDTFYPTLYNYERGYELGKKEGFLFAFAGVPVTNKEARFVFYDEIFNTGFNSFQFKLDEKNFPQLPIKNKKI